MDDPQMMLIKARHADLLAQAERWRTIHAGADQRRATRLIARADRLATQAERLRRHAVRLDQARLRPRGGSVLNLTPPR